MDCIKVIKIIRLSSIREGYEESLGVIGSQEFIYEILQDQSAHLEVFKHAFLIYLGQLTQEQRQVRFTSNINSYQGLVDLFQKKKKQALLPSFREMREVKWVKAKTLFEACIQAKGKIFLIGFAHWKMKKILYCQNVVPTKDSGSSLPVG